MCAECRTRAMDAAGAPTSATTEGQPCFRGDFNLGQGQILLNWVQLRRYRAGNSSGWLPVHIASVHKSLFFF